MSQPDTDIRYSIVVPIFNEQAVLPVLLRRLDLLMDALDAPAETIFVDDGSSDCSSIILEAKAKGDARYRYIGLSRNFGHQIAITAGMDAAAGAAIIVMDADLQDPPEVVHDMVARWRDGFDIVYAERCERDGETRFKRFTAALFYRFANRISTVKIPNDVGDFRLIDRKVLTAFQQMPEQDRFVRGMFAWLGFKQTKVSFHRAPRAAGATKYPLTKMIRLAVSGLIGFSDLPLRLAIWMGLCVSGSAIVYGAYAIGFRLLGGYVVDGWTSTIVVIAFLCGANMLMTGIVGLYVGRIFSEVKRRPLYVVDKRTGFDRPAALPGRGAAEEVRASRVAMR